jgi:hypothetical protein
MKITVKFIDLHTKQMVDYDSSQPKDKVQKFLFFTKEKVGMDLPLILCASFYLINEHKEIAIAARRFGLDELPKPDGAGDCKKGKIVGWSVWVITWKHQKNSNP